MKRLFKKSLVLGLAGLLGILTFNTPTYGAEALSGIYNTGTNKTITVSKAGKYTFNLYGAQGGNYGSYVGGKGGYVSFSKEVSVGDVVKIVTGAGAGTGEITNGGGYSAIYINEVLVGIAGGGGGATATIDGGDGGIGASGNTNINFEGESSTEAKTSGGGGGYRGGNSGLDHTHVGNETDGGECYQEPVYHVHTGDPATGTGCYTKPVYHTHDSSCNRTVACGNVYYKETRYVYDGSCNKWCNSWYKDYYACSGCGAEVGMKCGGGGNSCGRVEGIVGGQHLTTGIGCGKDPSSYIEYYDLGCGKVGNGNNGHSHSGSTLNGGACYQTPVYHQHSEYCNGLATCGNVYFKETRYVYDGSCNKWCSSWYKDYYACSGCGAEVGWRCGGGGNSCGATGGIMSGVHTKQGLSCGKSTSSVDFWLLSCTELENVIESYKFSCTTKAIQASGGSNYINESLVTKISDEGGVNGTDSYTAGKATIEVIDSVAVTLNGNEPAYTNNAAEMDVAEIKVIASHFNEELPTPRLIGYEFLGWSTTKNSSTYVVQNQEYDALANPTLYAQWSPIDITITMKKNNIYADEIMNDTVVVKYDTPYDLVAPTSKYSNFAGWALDEAGTKKITLNSTRVQTDSFAPEITVYAQWTPAQITLKFNATANGGTLLGASSKVVINEKNINGLPTATKSGYNFIGWFTSPSGGEQVDNGMIAFFDKSNSSHTLYAQFEPKVTDWPFQYTGQTQTWTAPSSGYYLFEAYGAQGTSINSTQVGGNGGFVAGVKFLNKGDVIYINVGGQGQPFNGGGTGTVKNGGGGTDFRLNGNSASNRFLVAGGGGGATETKVGGHGGVSDSGNHTDLVYGQGNNQEGGAGGGGGYYGGTAGYLIRHYHARSGCTQHYHGGGCYSRKDVYCSINSSSDGWSCNSPSGHCAGYCSYCGGHWAYCYLDHSYTYLSCTRSEGWQCGMYDGQITGQAPAYGGSNYVDSTLYYKQDQGGVRQGNGYAKITAMYTVVLDTNKPSTTNHYTANATNIPFIDNVDTLLQEKNLPYTTPNYNRFESTGDDTNKTTYGLYFVRDMFTYDSYEKLPVPTLKGWKFLGWYTYPQIDAGVKITDSTQVNVSNGLTLIDNHTLYAHWEPETYYIKYYMNNTNKNVYGDVYTDPVAKFDTSLTGAVKSGATKYTYNASEDCYIQTVQYDHDIEVLPNYYAKTGYYFKNWSNKSDTTLTGTKGTGTGTGKQTGTTYQESTILKPIKNGENFQTLKGNFNYITNEKALASGTEDTPVWAYGDQTIIFYATWEPIKYSLRFNGTDNWNESSSFTTGIHTAQDSYLQKVTNASGSQDIKIRYDQIFSLDANQFKREAPHTIKSPDGLDVVLKTGYGHLGWGFGKDIMKYSASPAYKLLSMNTKHDPDQALISDSDTTGRDYSDKQVNVKNVISDEGIEKITDYISDWSNARTDSNRKDKSDIESNVIESNLHSLWRRNSNDNHINEDTTGCPCPDDGNGGCICPSDTCPDRDGDGTCDYHDPNPDDPTIPSKCPCGTDENGNCICPSDSCPDVDGDGVCDNHDPNPDDPTIPNDGHDHGNKCPCGSDGNGNCNCPSSNCPDSDSDGICDNHDPDPNNPDIPNNNGDDNDDCPCGTGPNGECICPSDSCPDRDGDGVCDNHDPDPNNPHIPSRCPCGTDENGNCICPSDDCPDKDGDGVCDNHDPAPNNPYIPNVNKCPCGTDSNGNCICPSDNCPDNDKDGVCDNHDPDPNNPNIPNNQGSGSGGGDNNGGDPTNPNDTNFGITLTFDLNGGYINKNNRFYYSPIVLKQELFNDYFYEFDIIGNVNKDHLNHTAVADIYGAYSNTNTPKKNYNAYTGLNVIYNKGDGNGGLYRLSGWSTNKGAIYPDYKVTIDGIKNNNFDTFDATNNNNTIKICNDTTLYAVWEPVLQMNVELTNTVTGNKVKTGTLTDATQENMQRNGLPTLAVIPGQEIKYLIAIRGENKATVGSRIEPMNLTVEFDSIMTGIYNSQHKDLHDNLNAIAADDLDDPNETMLLSTSNLNRKFVKQTNKSIIRKFSIPLYLGTERAEEVGYPSFKEDGYTLNITLSRPSNFYKGDEVVTAKLILDTTGKLAGSNGSGGSGSGSGGNGGGSGGNGTGSNLPSATVGEFRTNIRIR